MYSTPALETMLSSELVFIMYLFAQDMTVPTDELGFDGRIIICCSQWPWQVGVTWQDARGGDAAEMAPAGGSKMTAGGR